MEQRPKHPSYNSQRVPTMQLMGMVSSFTGQRKDVATAQAREFVENNTVYEKTRPVHTSATYGQPIFRPNATAPSGPSMLDPKYVPEENKNAATVNVSSYKSFPKNHHKESDVGKLFQAADPTSVPAIPLPSKRMLGRPESNVNNGVIGGYTDVADPWQTTTQSAQEGEKIEFKSRHSMKKRLSELEPEDMISPITGNRVADYGHWAEDLKAKRAAALAAEEESEEEDTEQDPLLKRLQTQLASRGAKGIVGLARLFKIMDDDGSGSLCFAEFKKAMRDCKMVLTEMELLVLFKRFDRENTGAITYNNFLTAITGTLNKRRRRLVNMAFDVLDRDGSGSVDLVDIGAAYDVSLHPDFISGKRSKEDILREFLDGFDIGGTKDGVVTRAEFANYYSTISCSIARDDYFELMIRNAWHISGGEGAAANSANRRVLVTRADGSQFVQEITNDLGVGAKDKAGMAARLKEQGVDSANIDLYGTGDDNKSLGKLGARPPAKKSNKKFAAPETKTRAPVEPTPGIKLIIAKIKSEMKARGNGGFIGLQRRFRIMDDDGSKSLSLNEFKKALKEFKMDLTEADLRALFSFFDTDNSGSIDFEEFVQGVREPLTERRLKLVHMAFSVIDKDGSGMVDAQEVAGMYDASKHPEVIARRKTPTQVLTEFLDTFDVGGVKDGMVTKQEFVNYYSNLGASIDNDDYFELMIRNAWHLSGGEGNCANTTNMRVMVTDSSGTEKTIQIVNDLGLKKDDLPGIYARLKEQGVKDIKSINGRVVNFATQNGRETLSAGGTTAQLNTNEFKIPQVQRAPAANRAAPLVSAPVPPSLATLNLFTKQPVAMRSGLASKVMNSLQQKQAEQDRRDQEVVVGNTLLDVLRVQLLSRGPAGIINLQRKFVDMDTNGSKSLSYSEFKQAVLSNKMTFTDDQLKALFNFFDTDGSGEIDYQELMYGLRGQLPPALLVLVHQVFDLLDKQGVDSIDPQNLIAHFDASRHPEVLSRAKSAQAVQKEFLDTFDVGGEVPGRIARTEFVRYYTNIRASFNDDDYFEVVLRKVWHLGEEVSSAKMAAYRDHLNGSNQRRETSSLAGKLRQAQTLDAAASRRPSSASATRRPSTSQYGTAGQGAYSAFNQNFSSGPASNNNNNNTFGATSYAAPPAASMPSRPQSAGPLGRGRLNPGYNRSNAAPAPAPPSYEQVEVIDPATGNVDEDAVWKAAKKIQSEAVQCYNNQQLAEAEEKFRDVFEVMKMIFEPSHPEYIKAEKSCLMVERKRSAMGEYGRPSSSRGYGY